MARRRTLAKRAARAKCLSLAIPCSMLMTGVWGGLLGIFLARRRHRVIVASIQPSGTAALAH
jgi:hypothetical protein